jgi:hypothetical protein
MASFLYIETEFYAVTFLASMGRRESWLDNGRCCGLGLEDGADGATIAGHVRLTKSSSRTRESPKR